MVSKFSKVRRLSGLIFPTGVENWFEFAGVSSNRGFEKSRLKLQCSSEANPRETTTGSSYREVRETEGSRNRDSTVHVTVPRAGKRARASHGLFLVCFVLLYFLIAGLRKSREFF